MNNKDVIPKELRLPKRSKWYQGLMQKIWPWSLYRKLLRGHMKRLVMYKKMYEMMEKHPLEIPIYPYQPIVKINKNGDCFIPALYSRHEPEDFIDLKFTIEKYRESKEENDA